MVAPRQRDVVRARRPARDEQGMRARRQLGALHVVEIDVVDGELNEARPVGGLQQLAEPWFSPILARPRRQSAPADPNCARAALG